MGRVRADEAAADEEPDVLIVAVPRSTIAIQGVEPRPLHPHRLTDLPIARWAPRVHERESRGQAVVHVGRTCRGQRCKHQQRWTDGQQKLPHVKTRPYPAPMKVAAPVEGTFPNSPMRSTHRK